MRIINISVNWLLVNKLDISAQYTAELIAFLSRLARWTEEEVGLNSAQLAALRYFASATKTSCTVTAFADYHVTTRGTASQTIKGLVAKGLLSRERSPTDRRVTQISLTPAGRAQYEKDPLQNLTNAIKALPAGEGADLAATLESLTQGLTEEWQKRQFGLCARCHHLRRAIGIGDEEETYFCRLIRQPLSKKDLDAFCMDYQSRAR